MSGSANRPVALVTGATSGIGAATAIIFCSDGWDLLLLGRRQDRLERTQHELSSMTGSTVEIGAVEQSDHEGFASALHQANGTGDLRLVVLAAGHGMGYGSMHDSEPDAWAPVVNDNLLATIRQIRSACEVLDGRIDARIIVIGSVHSESPAPSQAVYAAAKHGLRGFLESVRAEGSVNGPGLTLLNPGATNTEFADVANGIADPQVHRLDEWPTPPLTPDRVASVVRWLSTMPNDVDIPTLSIVPKSYRPIQGFES